MAKDFHKLSYERHQQTYNDVKEYADLELYRDWLNNGTVDLWRHLRMLENINPFLESYKAAKWLTVGDGGYGTSAMYIKDKGGDALPTDIDVSLLKIAKENQMISSYQYANAESLPFEDDSFDFTLCKESFHHFPRAYIALHEMIRVSKKAVILIEPADWLPNPVPRRILGIIKNVFRNVLRIPVPHPDTGNFEPIGNYIFSVSKREIQKIAMGINLPAVAFKEFHDVYFKGVEYEKAGKDSVLLKKLQRQISINHFLYRLGLTGKNHIAAVIFKCAPDRNLESGLKKTGYDFIPLPVNPYFKK